MQKNISFYIHIPFCEQKCKYCSFVSFGSQSEKTKNDYFDALYNEILSKKQTLKDYIIKTIYIGGGTPSVVDEKYIVKIIELIRNNYLLDDKVEISIEANPNSATFHKLTAYKNAGINRISFGVQSLKNKTLQDIGRLHSAKDAKIAIKNAKRVGFKSINADILLGLKAQTTLNAKNTAKKLISYGATHISAYMLMIEDGTPLKLLVESKEYTPATDDQSVKIYAKLATFLSNKGYERYEVSNFAKKSYECQHNQVYWNLDEYIGFGLAAHSYFNDKRTYNTSSMQLYCSKQYLSGEESLSKKEKTEELVMLSLRTREGLDLNKYQQISGKNILIEKSQEIELLTKIKAIQIENNHLFVRQKHYGVLNQIILKLI